MPKHKKSDTEIISTTLAKKIKTSYVEIEDSNALILPPKPKESKKSKEIDKPVEILSKKQRKLLTKKLRDKEQKITTAELYAELAAFDNLKPKEAIKKFKEEIQGQPQSRSNLSEKVKTATTKKLKSWQKAKNKNHVEKTKESSPDTSDFSSDDDIEIDNEDGTEIDKSSVDIINQSETLIDKHNLDNEEIKHEIKKRNDEDDDEENVLRNNLKSIPLTYVTVDRPKEVQTARLKLPILEEETNIMEAISENDVVILSGATGCGKTTQVPQFLYEAGYTNNGMQIGITEPRRVAAISMSKRVTHELGCEHNNLVSYHIRYDKTATCSTKIKFMTDGILLQELKQDPLLSTYSVIIIDEAHERSVYSDILIGFLSIIVRTRRRDYENASDSSKNKIHLPLKLIIMSATLRVGDFSENIKLFPGPIRPPVINLPARQFPVDIHFNRITQKDYLKEAFKKVVQVHGLERDGGILVFVTGQDEVHTLCKWLRLAFPVTNKFLNRIQNPENTKEIKHIVKEDKLVEVNLTDFSIIPIDEESEMTPIETNIQRKNTDSCEEDDNDDDDEDSYDHNDVIEDIISGTFKNISLDNPIYALPLYSLLSKEKQELVFQDPPPGQRLVVVATNVAETSLTIPNIKYVIDTGMEKVKRWDPITGVSRFEIDRISKSSAEQRTGRAGRVSHGKCYRLYSSAVFEEMKLFSEPEIVQRPIEDVILMLRNFLHCLIPINQFPLPTTPSEIAIQKAEHNLLTLGALKRIKLSSKTVTEITEVGKLMSSIPLNSRFARMLIMANQHGLLPYAVLMVSALSVNNFFTSGSTDFNLYDDKEKNNLPYDFKRKFVQKRPDLLLGDISVFLGAVCQMEKVYSELSDECKVKQIAEIHGIRWQAFVEVRKLRKQLSDILNANIKNLNLDINPYLPRPTNAQFENLRQLVLAGSASNVARLAPLDVSLKKDLKQRRKEKGMYQCSSIDKPVYIHSQSVLQREKSQWVVYQDVFKSYLNGKEDPKAYIRSVTVIEPEWLPIFCTLECKVEGLILNHLVDEDSTQLPSYDENHDCIMLCAKKIFYGSRNLLLPTGVRIRGIPDILENETTQRDKLRRWFAKFFMEGSIFKVMENWRSKFKSSCKPDFILNPIGSQRPEVKSIMNGICELQIHSKEAICEKWKENKNYLLNSYLDWVLPDEHEFIISNWPPIEMK